MNDATPPTAHTPAPAAETAGSTAESPADTLIPPAAEPLATLRRRAGRRLAVLSLLGAVMVVLPLVQVLRYQNVEEAALIADRAGLDPVTHAVDVQRSLLAHRDISTLVLSGRSEQEPARKVRQGEVDDRVGALALTLASGQWQRAVQESDALRDDWGLLARQVGAKSVSADESEQAHRLLVEQTLQVIDIVADAMAPHARAPSGQVLGAVSGGLALPSTEHLSSDNTLLADQDAGRLKAALGAAHALPRLAWQMALLLPQADGRNGSGTALPRNDLAAVEAGLARTLGALNAALAQHPRPTLAAAGAAAGVAADGYFQALRSRDAAAGNSSNASNVGLQRSAAQALQAQFDLFQYAHDEAANGLSAQIEAVQAQRSHWLTGMAALAVVWLAVLLGAVRTLRAPVTPPPQHTAPLPAATSVPLAQHQRGEATRLLQRLRQGQERHARAGSLPGITSRAAQPDATAQPTSPGRL